MKPLLACKADLTKLTFPLVASPKLDGIRCLVKDGVLVSRTLKPIRNKYCQELFKGLPDGLDGELIVGDPTAEGVFQKSTSGVMSIEGEPDVTYHVFDVWNQGDADYPARNKLLFGKNGNTRLCVVEGVWIDRLEQVNSYYEYCLEQGYEGIMLRDPTQPYKFGRSTLKSQHLLKHKPFEDSEFKVVGLTEKMHNANEATTNALGATERSSASDGLVGTDTLGALVCEMEDGTRFNVGTGFTDAQRKEIWMNPLQYVGKWVKVQHQEIGAKDLPRFPSFQGWRDKEDM